MDSHVHFIDTIPAYITPPASTPPLKPQLMTQEERNAAINAQLLALGKKARKDSLQKNPHTIWISAPRPPNNQEAVRVTHRGTHAKDASQHASAQPGAEATLTTPAFRILPYSDYPARMTFYSTTSPNALRALLLAGNSNSETLNPNSMYIDPFWEEHELPPDATWLVHLPQVLNVDRPGDGDIFGFYCKGQGEELFWACVHAHLVHLFSDWCSRRAEDGEMLLMVEDFAAKDEDATQREHELWYLMAKAWLEREFPPG